MTDPRSPRSTAERMGVSERAIEQHVTSLFDGANVESRGALVSRVLAP